MHWQEFVASLVSSLAWPVIVLIVAVLFRRQLADLMSSSLRRVKAGPFEAEWDRAEERVPGSFRAAAARQRPDSVEAASADISPRTAILERYTALVARVDAMVTKKLGQQPDGGSVGDLFDLAEANGVISAETKQALVGMTVMRNLAAHDPRDLEPVKATEFMALADATEYAVAHGEEA